MRAFLLSDSCTTGWLRWGHGELWLTPSHLVRIGRPELTRRAAGWGGTKGGAAFGAGAAGTDAAETLVRSAATARPVPGSAIEVDPELWEQEVTAEPGRTLVLNLEEVATVQFRQGITASRLGVGMADGVKHKLLWLPNAHSKSVLAESLGSRLAFS
jgi:hypothetical protein